MTTFQDASVKLHRYLLKKCWNGQALVGPDQGVRFNARIGRFIKSYLSFIPWRERRMYLQTQGYWIKDNWRLYEMTGEHRYKDLALTCTNTIAASQRPEGYWEYPDQEWKGRIATVEGDFATIGLLESYNRTKNEAFLAAAKKWYHYLIDVVGFQGRDGLLAINYFSNVRGGMVPNNTTLTILTLAKLADATGDKQYLSTCEGMVRWLNEVQLDSGELPYAMAGEMGRADRIHFLCYQYNSFEFLDLVEYYELTNDQTICPVMEKLARYLTHGIKDSGAVWYDCHHDTPEVTYYAAASAAAMSQANRLGLGDYRALADQGYKWVLAQQKRNGGFKFHSRANYRFLSDRRSYPRNLSMILSHFLLEAQTGSGH